MFSRISQFIVHVADLAEAEGRVLRDVVDIRARAVRETVQRLAQRLILWTLAAVVAVVALGFLAAGLIWLLAWWVTWPVALILVAALLFGGVYLLLRLAGGPDPGTLEADPGVNPGDVPPPVTPVTPPPAAADRVNPDVVDAGSAPDAFGRSTTEDRDATTAR